MDDIGIGLAIRALRLRSGLRQADVAARAGVSQSVVSRCERGHLQRLPWRVIRGIAEAVGMRVELRGRWRGGELDRLLDADHAALQAWFIATLRSRGWEAAAEITYNRYGERGSIDVLAYHPATQTLLVVEVKTVIADLQGILRPADVKLRLAPFVARGLGWMPRSVAGCLVVADERTNRRRISAHESLLGRFGLRGSAARRWLRRPVETGSGLLVFRSLTTSQGRNARQAGRQRVRIRRAFTSVGAATHDARKAAAPG